MCAWSCQCLSHRQAQGSSRLHLPLAVQHQACDKSHQHSSRLSIQGSCASQPRSACIHSPLATTQPQRYSAGHQQQALKHLLSTSKSVKATHDRMLQIQDAQIHSLCHHCTASPAINHPSTAPIEHLTHQAGPAGARPPTTLWYHPRLSSSLSEPNSSANRPRMSPSSRLPT